MEDQEKCVSSPERETTVLEVNTALSYLNDTPVKMGGLPFRVRKSEVNKSFIRLASKTLKKKRKL